MRLSRMLRKSDVAMDDPVRVRSMVLWALVGVAIVIGVVLYFRYEPSIAPLVG